jgi:hypothetical protein
VVDVVVDHVFSADDGLVAAKHDLAPIDERKIRGQPLEFLATRIFFLSNGRLRRLYTRQLPRQTGAPKPWSLNQIKKLAVLHQRFKLDY